MAEDSPTPEEAPTAPDAIGDVDEDLEPARYEANDGEAKTFAPRFPWHWLLLAVLVPAAVAGSYLYREGRAVDALREQVADQYAREVEPDARRLRGFRQKLEELITQAAASEPRTHADERLRFANLHDAKGVYLRLRAADAHSAEDIERGSRRMMPDAFTRCLGVAPTSLRGLFLRSDFVSTEWPEQLREANTRLRLRVIRDELTRHVRRDLPLLTDLMDADYFLLTLEQEDGAFDVFLWDLQHGQELLSTRARPSGLLLPVRVDLPGIPDGPRYRRSPHPVGAQECSIAGHVKVLTHEDTMSFGSHLPSEEDGPAANGDAGVDATSTGHTPADDSGAQTPN